MQKVMTSIAFMFAIFLAACQATTTTNGAKLNETTSVESEVPLVANNRADPGPGREFRIRSGISCRALNRASPTFADELSKHFSSGYQRKINQLRKYEARWVRLCSQLSSVKTKKQARSWLGTRENIARSAIQNRRYWIESQSLWRWSDAEEVRIWHAFLCSEGNRNMERIAQVTAEVIAENKPRSTARAKQKAQSIKARVSNLCSRRWDGNEKKFISESKGVYKSYQSLWRLSK